MNMFKSVKATSVNEYIDMVPDDRKKSIRFLHGFIKKTSPKLKQNFIYNMPGYGTFTYKNRKGELLDWPIIALANQKNYISLYICALESGKYLAEKYKSELGKVSVGKSCIRFKSVDDINLKTLAKIIKLAEKFPGLRN